MIQRIQQMCQVMNDTTQLNDTIQWQGHASLEFSFWLSNMTLPDLSFSISGEEILWTTKGCEGLDESDEDDELNVWPLNQKDSLSSTYLLCWLCHPFPCLSWHGIHEKTATMVSIPQSLLSLTINLSILKLFLCLQQHLHYNPQQHIPWQTFQRQLTFSFSPEFSYF